MKYNFYTNITKYSIHESFSVKLLSEILNLHSDFCLDTYIY